MTLVIMLISFAQMVCGTPFTQAKNDRLTQARQMTKCDRKVRRVVAMRMRPVRAKKFVDVANDFELGCRIGSKIGERSDLRRPRDPYPLTRAPSACPKPCTGNPGSK